MQPPKTLHNLLQTAAACCMDLASFTSLLAPSELSLQGQCISAGLAKGTTSTGLYTPFS